MSAPTTTGRSDPFRAAIVDTTALACRTRSAAFESHGLKCALTNQNVRPLTRSMNSAYGALEAVPTVGAGRSITHDGTAGSHGSTSSYLLASYRIRASPEFQP